MNNIHFGKLISLSTQHSHQFKLLFEVLKNSITDIKIKFTKKYNKNKGDEDDDDKKGGIFIKTLNEHKTVLLHIHLPFDKFDEYIYNHDEDSYSIMFSLEEFNKFIRTIEKNDDIISLHILETDQNYLYLNKINRDNNSYTSEWKIKLMDLLDDADKNISLSLSVIDKFIAFKDSSLFHKILKDFENVGNTLNIICSDQEVYFKCGGGSNAESSIKISNGDNSFVDILKGNNDTILNLEFDLKEFSPFNKCNKLSDSLVMGLANTFPIVLIYRFGLGNLKICISPKSSNNVGDNYDDNGDDEQYY